VALSVPNYIQSANVQDVNIRYPWDDWNVEQAEEPIDEEFVARIKGISPRAIIAFTTGTAEWIVHRFATLSDDPLPLQFLEAAWAMIIDMRYCGVVWDDHTRESVTWTGPIRRPLAIAMTRVQYTFQAILEYGDIELSAAWITNLAQYILSDPGPYRGWRERVVGRLEALYPHNPEDKLGEVVPREAVDPHYEFQLAQTESLINRFLATLDRSNPFLNSPDKMHEQGFVGTPYVFNIEEERESRLRN
jgi:hypothetical protein